MIPRPITPFAFAMNQASGLSYSQFIMAATRTKARLRKQGRGSARMRISLYTALMPPSSRTKGAYVVGSCAHRPVISTARLADAPFGLSPPPLRSNWCPTCQTNSVTTPVAKISGEMVARVRTCSGKSCDLYTYAHLRPRCRPPRTPRAPAFPEA